MKHLHEKIKPYSKAIVKLLKGTVNKTDSIWNDVLIYQVEINEYINTIGLELILKEDDGFAFLKQFEIDNTTIGLVSRRQVGFETSIVLMILRQMIEEFESNPTDDLQVSEKFITQSELIEQVSFFLPEKYNTVKFLESVERYINKVEELGYLKEVGTSFNEKKYKIHKIIKEKITLDVLYEFKEKLKQYVESI